MISNLSIKLALENIKKNKKIITPYIISSIFMTSMFYIIVSLKNNENITSISIKQLFYFGINIIMLFLVIFLLYTYSFILKNRTKELGLYSVLGMTKKNIAKIITIELLIIYFITTTIGTFLGIVFDKLCYLILIKLMEGDIKFGFYFSLKSILTNFALFLGIYLIIIIISIIKVYRLNTIKLLKYKNKGEKEPKNRIILSVMGIIFIGYGYYTALIIKTPLEALSKFFYAVTSVIIGTYLLFIAISIFILKILKNNKNFYYKPKNFISVSKMIYRMKKNAVGLASICILSTMTLVTLSSTTSLYCQTENMINEIYPKDVAILINKSDKYITKNISEYATKIAEKNGEQLKNKLEYTYLSTVLTKKGNGIFEIAPTEITNDFSNKTTIVILPLEEYKNKTNETLKEDEILIQGIKAEYPNKEISIQGKTYKVKKQIKDIENTGQAQNILDSYYIVVKDRNVLEKIEKYIIEYIKIKENTTFETLKQGYIAFDITNKNNSKEKIEKELKENKDKILAEKNNKVLINLEIKREVRKELKGIYAGLLFIGIFMSIIFLISQIVIMYYKQIAEGYEDKKSFDIMQRVGLNKKEIKKSIKSQILIIFFAPLVVAIIHTLVAYPFIEKVLKTLQLANTKVFFISISATILIFIIFYFIVYVLTSKLYYNIIKEN